MEENNLINFNIDSCVKLASPLIPLPVDPQQKYRPRLSDVDNNPFDKVLRKIMRKDDPFECVCEETFVHIEVPDEEKENVERLISPIETPVKNKKQIKISTTPLYLGERTLSSPLIRKDLENVQATLCYPRNGNADLSNSSLQFLNESVLNDTLNCGFVASNIEGIDENSKNSSQSSNVQQIPEIYLNEETRYSNDSNHNHRIKSVSSTNSDKFISFNSDSLNINEISNIPSSTFLSGSSKTNTVLDKAFILDSINTETIMSPEFRRRCMSASRPMKTEIDRKDLTARCQLNNSFSGFHFNDRIDEQLEESEQYFSKHDSVLLEDQKMKKKGDISDILAALDDKDEINAISIPPWVEENLDLLSESSEDEADVENDNVTTINNHIEQPPVHNPVEEPINNCVEETDKPPTDIVRESPEEKCAEGNTTREVYEININFVNNNDTFEVQKADNLLKKIKNILEHNKDTMENKLSEIALALDIDNSVDSKVRSQMKLLEEGDVKHREKLDTSVQPTAACDEELNQHPPKDKVSCLKNLQSKLKNRTAKLTSTDKNLKVKNEKEKEKSNVKGPLKAVIPLTNMAKTKKSIAAKISTGNTSNTPPKVFHLQKTSTPNEPKFKNPVAQSTPNTSTKPSTHGSTTPTRLTPMRSSLPRPSSTNDLNKSISPKDPNTSSTHAIPQNKTANRLTPSSGNSLLRRKSSSDLKESNNAHRIPETEKNCKSSRLKRSTSFQNKFVKS